jgi:hypothetical protein
LAGGSLRTACVIGERTIPRCHELRAQVTCCDRYLRAGWCAERRTVQRTRPAGPAVVGPLSARPAGVGGPVASRARVPRPDDLSVRRIGHASPSTGRRRRHGRSESVQPVQPAPRPDRPRLVRGGHR